MNYLVSYDLNKSGKDYSGVYEAIQSASTGMWCKPLESVYIIRSSLSAEAIYNRVAQHLDRDDCVLVIEVTENYFGYFDKRVVDYLNSML